MHYLPLTTAAISDLGRSILKGSMQNRAAINFSLRKVLGLILEPLRIIPSRYGLIQLDSSIEKGGKNMDAHAAFQQYVQEVFKS